MATCLHGHRGGAYGGAYSAVLCVCLAQRRRIRTAFRLNFRGVRCVECTRPSQEPVYYHYALKKPVYDHYAFETSV